MKRSLLLVGAAMLMLSQCAARQQPWTRPVPSIEDVFSTASHEERVLKLFHAVKRLGNVPYVWGGTSPHWGMDCSGFTQYVMKEIGVSLPRTVREQARAGERVERLMPGDLVFFDADGGREGLDHVGIYLGRDWFAHCVSPLGVTIQDLDDYGHGVRLARRVMHERTGVVESAVAPVVTSGAVVNITSSSRPTSFTREPPPEECEKKPAPTHGRLVKTRLADDKVYYTVEREGSSPYEFYVSKEVHENLVDENGVMLGRELEWDDDYVWVRD